MKNVMALVLAGGRTGHYGVLTQNRAKGALTFAGNYRIIDFALSNLRRARIEQIGIIMQYLPASLIEHVGVGHPWDLNGYGRCLKIMPPFVGVERTEWYKGTADALYQNLNFVEDLAPEHIVVTSGEHVCHLDFRALLDAHRDQRADITFVTKEMPAARCTRRFGYVVADESGRVTSFVEKPDTPPGRVTSIGTYVFRAPVLRELLESNRDPEKQNLSKHLLQDQPQRLRCYAFPMDGEWEYMEGVEDYYRVQMELLQPGGLDLLRRWNLLTNLEFRGVGFAPAAHIGRGASVEESLIGANCRIEGTVLRSILSPGTVVAEGAVVRDSILMHDCTVESAAVLDGVVADRDAVFGQQSRAGAPGAPGGLTLVGKAARVAGGVTVPAGGQVPPRTVFS